MEQKQLGALGRIEEEYIKQKIEDGAAYPATVPLALFLYSEPSTNQQLFRWSDSGKLLIFTSAIHGARAEVILSFSEAGDKIEVSGFVRMHGQTRCLNIRPIMIPVDLLDCQAARVSLAVGQLLRSIARAKVELLYV